MQRVLSLRVRLFALIVVPVVLIGMLLGMWRITEARSTSEDLFDRALLAAALSVARDVAISGGDALLPSTRTLIEDAAGGQIFYHVTGPQGTYVTGYAYPPVPTDVASTTPGQPEYSHAAYRGENVRVLQLAEQLAVGVPAGDSLITVWQRLSDRNAFTRDLIQRSAVLIGGLIATVAAVIWLAVRWGLRPLLELEHAISLRSPDDLRPVQREVPVETTGIVRTFNGLLTQIQASIQSHQIFISDAAHQLRNPAAAVLALAEAARAAPTDAERQSRLDDVIRAARQSNRTAEQLLSLDRLQQTHVPLLSERDDLNRIATEVCTEVASDLLSSGIEFEVDLHPTPLPVTCDLVLVQEALRNLIDNAQQHGGPGMTQIIVRSKGDTRTGVLQVWDDGIGIAPQDQTRALERFSQISPSNGSGLGLAIVQSVVLRHEGSLSFMTEGPMNGIEMAFPRLLATR